MTVHLVQVVLPDIEYRQQANELAIALSEPHVKGVFEERLPLDLHAALQLGCVTAVKPESRSKSMQDGFELTDLHVHLHTLSHSFIHSFIPSFIPSFIHLFIHSFIPSFIHLFLHSFIH